jgi:hypothetical protein
MYVIIIFINSKMSLLIYVIFFSVSILLSIGAYVLFNKLNKSDSSCKADCLGNTICNKTTGTCECPKGYTGLACDIKLCSSICTPHGKCDNDTGTCVCNIGYTGIDCGIPKKCEFPCDQKHGICNWDTKKCHCIQGYRGADCSEKINKDAPDIDIM